MHGLRRSRHKKRLVKTLVNWKRENKLDKTQASQFPHSTSNVRPSAEEQREKTQVQIVKAEASFRGGGSQKALQHHSKPALMTMCSERSLSTDGTKAQLAQRLIEWRDSRAPGTSLLPPPSHPPQPAMSGSTVPMPSIGDYSGHRDTSGVVLGRETLLQIQEDMLHTVLPTWMSHAPRNLGTTERGKLSADQWLSACSINFPFTLIRLWGSEEGRKKAMLENYMDLVTAVVISSMLKITDEHVQLYEKSIRRYLTSFKELYKEAEIKPNHHLSLHVGQFLRMFGPVHSVRTFFSERMNYTLQRENTNRKFGELELTFMKTTCRVANLRALLQTEEVKGIVAEFSDAYDQVLNSDTRGTRVRQSLFASGPFTPQGDPGKTPKTISLDDSTFKTLLELLNSESGQEYFIDIRELRRIPGRQQISNTVVTCRRLVIGGISYRSTDVSLNDSNIYFQVPSKGSLDLSAGQIKSIFLLTRRDTRGEKVQETFLSVERYAELSSTDAKSDNYRRFPYVGGRLFYDELIPDVLVIRPVNVVSHFARTPVRIAGISSPCVHALPLDRVSKLVQPIYEQDDENIDVDDVDERAE